MNTTSTPRALSDSFSVTSQLTAEDAAGVAALGFKAVICNRPDGESDDQPSSDELEKAFANLGIPFHRVFVSGSSGPTPAAVEEFAGLLESIEGPILAFCRSGTRSATLWAKVQVQTQTVTSVLAALGSAGFEIDSFKARLAAPDTAGLKPVQQTSAHHRVVIVGGGAAGIATAASLLKRDSTLDIAIIEPALEHSYQPGWTLVGAGVFKPEKTRRSMHSVIPSGVTWIRESVTEFQAENQCVKLSNGDAVRYDVLVAAPGILLDWSAIEGLTETLGRNNVTSNYAFEHASYTWELVKNFRSGRALFTQPTMPIKCAGAPQKAMYLSCSHWESRRRLADIDVQFHTAGKVLFGVADYVPALETYIKRYNAHLNFTETLVAVDGPAQKAWFDTGEGQQKEVCFDFLHVCPPQRAPDVVCNSALANEAGWIDVDQNTLQHCRLPNVFSLGDACSAPNAKTAAAVRKQAPVVASNICSFLAGRPLTASYAGYGSCPLTVEHGKVVLAEFGYGGVLQPTAPNWLLDGTQATRMGWILKADMLPTIYWQLMLKGREWLAAPEQLGVDTAGGAPHSAVATQSK